MTATATEVEAIAACLWMMPPPAKTIYAPRLAAKGLRIHPELATKKLVGLDGTPAGPWTQFRPEPLDPTEAVSPRMPSKEDIEQMGALALSLLVLPAPLPRVLAPDLFALGARVHPGLADGNDSPAEMAKLLGILRRIEQRAPHLAGMADEIEEAQAAAEAGDMSLLRALGERIKATALAQSAEAKRLAEDIDPEEWADQT